ncbi:hypothetical protein AMTRI_Chr03g144000 [Amborella trichopoda]
MVGPQAARPCVASRGAGEWRVVLVVSPWLVFPRLMASRWTPALRVWRHIAMLVFLGFEQLRLEEGGRRLEPESVLVVNGGRERWRIRRKRRRPFESVMVMVVVVVDKGIKRRRTNIYRVFFFFFFLIIKKKKTLKSEIGMKLT